MKKIVILFVLCVTAGYGHAQNTAYGMNAGNAGAGNSSFGAYAADVVTGTNNCSFGIYTGTSLTGGSLNSFFGAFSGANTTTGLHNTFIGNAAGNANASSSNNTFVGTYSGYVNTASDNTFMGYNSGRYNTTGQYNTAIGISALSANVTSSANTALGYYSLANNSTGELNTAVGAYALRLNAQGTWNTAMGHSALSSTTTGTENAALGTYALSTNTTGSWNVAMGPQAGYGNLNAGGNVAIGYKAALGANFNNTVAIGVEAVVTAANQVRLGNFYTTSIGGFADWSNVSDGRFKSDVKEDVAGLGFINQLKPVSFVLNQKAVGSFLKTGTTVSKLGAVNEKQARRTGFIAQQVEEVVSKGNYAFYGVDAPKNENDAYSIRYAEFVVPLVKAVQELSAKVEAQQKQIDSLLRANKRGGDVKQPGATDGGSGAVLFQNSPNPFTSDTNIRVMLPATVSQAVLKIYNYEGTEVKTVEISERGDAAVTLYGSALTHGIYVYTLVVDGVVVDTKRMVLTR